MSGVELLAWAALATWIVLLLARGGFWRADQRLGEPPPPATWPPVAAVIPARDEAETIGRTVASLKAQDYPGAFSVIVVDDGSSDGTADLAREAGADSVIAGEPLEEGWTGKLWAQSQGITAAGKEPRWLLFTDADIEHDARSLSRLVAKAESENLALVSLMVLLRAKSFWERLLIPAFVFFFQKLYPFPSVNSPYSKVAAAAGGCVLIRRDVLAEAGGLRKIKAEVIDDCALAALIKPRAPIWLGLTTRVTSLRAYDGLGEIWRMVTRTAYVQLRHSPWMVLGTVLAMGLIYGAPVVTTLLGSRIGAVAWILMATAYLPTLRLWNLGAWRAPLLPLAAVLYTLMTVDSARRHHQGKGGAWKGRTYP